MSADTQRVDGVWQANPQGLVVHAFVTRHRLCNSSFTGQGWTIRPANTQLHHCGSCLRLLRHHELCAVCFQPLNGRTRDCTDCSAQVHAGCYRRHLTSRTCPNVVATIPRAIDRPELTIDQASGDIEIMTLLAAVRRAGFGLVDVVDCAQQLGSNWPYYSDPKPTTREVAKALRQAWRAGLVAHYQSHLARGGVKYQLTDWAQQLLSQLEAESRYPELPPLPEWRWWQLSRERAQNEVPKLRLQIRGLAYRLLVALDKVNPAAFRLPEAEREYTTEDFGSRISSLTSQLTRHLAALQEPEPAKY